MIVLVLAAALICCLAAPSWAEHRRIVVVGDSSYAPLEFSDPEGHARGIMVDVWRLWSAKTGVEVDYRVMEWARALEEVRRGRADVVAGLFYSRDRSAWLEFGEPYYYMPANIFFDKSVMGIKDASDLSGFQVGVVKADYAEDWLRSHSPGAVLTTYPGADSLVRAAVDGKVRVFVCDAPVARFHLSRLQSEDRFQQSQKPLYTLGIRPAAAKGRREIMALVNSGMSQITPQEIEEIKSRWSGVPAAGLLDWSWLGLSLGLAMLTVLAVIIWNAQLRRRVSQTVQDLERQRRALAASEEQARANEEKYRHLLEHHVDLVAEMDSACRFTFVSPSLVELTGIPIHSLLGSPMAGLLRPEDRQALDDWLAALARSPYTGRLEVWTSTVKGWRWLAWTARGVPDDQGGLDSVVAVGRDITARKRIEDERRRLAAAVEQASQAVVIADMQGTVEYVNPAFERLTGLARQEVMGLPGGIAKALGNPEGLPPEARRALMAGQNWHGQFAAHAKDGRAYQAESTVSPIRDTAERPTRYVVLTRDVTHETLLERQLRQIQKMEAIGTLAGGIAHDFNNLLLAVVGYTELAIRQTPEAAPARQHLTQVLTACRRARDLVRQILAFSRGGDAAPLPVSLSEVVEEGLSLLKASLPENVTVNFTTSGSPDTVVADPIQLHQVLINLCSNAAYAMRDGGGSLEVGIGEAAEAPLQEPRSEGWLRLTVADTGPGIPLEASDRLFEPFFTTKPLGEGTGMGLAVVHGVVRALGGVVQVRNRPGGGALFQVYLPRSVEPLPAPDSSPPKMPRGGERILLVDDEESLAEMVRELLSALGYEAESHTDPLAAWERYQEDPRRWHLVISDQSMPGLSGDELVARLRRLRPDQPILLTSGYHQRGERLSEVPGHGPVAFLPKPYDMGQLARQVRKVLDDAIASGIE